MSAIRSTFAVLVAAAIGLVAGARCHTQLPAWLAGSPADAPVEQDANAQLWTCGMHPQVIQDHPGFCPICRMALTPLAGTPGAALTIDPAVVQNMGIKTAEVRTGTLTRTIRAVGRVVEAEPNVREVNLRVTGWIRRLHADTDGMRVDKHAPLFELDSPELHALVEEAIQLRRAGQAELHAAAVRRLVQRGLGPAQAERLTQQRAAPRTITFTSPIAGVVIDKQIVEGAAIEPGTPVLRIVDHRTLWIDAAVFEQHLAAIAVGLSARAQVAALPGEHFAAEVLFVHPHVDPDTRTAIVRIEVDNAAMKLRPGMFATVELDAELARDALLVPREAVIDTGARQVAFVALGEGHFEAREVAMGPGDGAGTVQVLAGLAAGERVVTSGQFLLDAESRTREAVQKFLREGDATSPPPAAHEHAPAVAPDERARTPRPKPDKPRSPHAQPQPPAPSAPTDAPVYHCPMHPQVQQASPGSCPICHMDLELRGSKP